MNYSITTKWIVIRPFRNLAEAKFYFSEHFFLKKGFYFQNILSLRINFN
jgi:hypothetical protein